MSDMKQLSPVKQFLLSHLDNPDAASSFCSLFPQSVVGIDVKLLCHGITLRQAQICPDPTSLSELACSAAACDV